MGSIYWQIINLQKKTDHRGSNDDIQQTKSRKMEVIKEKVSRVTSRFPAHTTGWMVILTGAEDIKPSLC